MPWGTVGVQQSPTPDRKISNLKTSRSSEEVYVQATADLFTTCEYLEDQAGSGTGAVLTFTFPSEVHLALIRSQGGTARATYDGTPPTAMRGAVVSDLETSGVPVPTTVVKVFAPSGVTVSVWGFRY